jgi:hypothetical protein
VGARHERSGGDRPRRSADRLILGPAIRGGLNLRDGYRDLLTDFQEALTGRPAEGSRLAAGRDLASTPGKVVLRNRLIELIQYAPTTPRVRCEPVLIVPAWIMLVACPLLAGDDIRSQAAEQSQRLVLDAGGEVNRVWITPGTAIPGR